MRQLTELERQVLEIIADPMTCTATGDAVRNWMASRHQADISVMSAHGAARRLEVLGLVRRHELPKMIYYTVTSMGRGYLSVEE